MRIRKIIAPLAVGLACTAGTIATAAQETPPLDRERSRQRPPISTSRFAPSPESFRELRMIGQRAPEIPAGPVVVGEPSTEYVEGERTILLFWSPLVSTSAIHLKNLALATRNSEDVNGVAIALGPETTTRRFLEELPERASLPPVIADTEERSRRTFLEPLGLSALPTFVVVDGDGTVMFHGDAQRNILTINQIVAGSWDRDRYVDDALEWAARQEVIKQANRLHGLARRGEADLDEAIAILDEAAALDPTNEVFQVRKFDILLLDPDRHVEAYELGRELMERFPRSALILNELAWHVVSYPNVADRDLDFALDASRRSNALQGWVNPSHLDTLARVHWLRGEREDAIRWQREAVSYAPEDWYGDAARENLRIYTDGSLEPGAMPPTYVSPRRPVR